MFRIAALIRTRFLIQSISHPKLHRGSVFCKSYVTRSDYILLDNALSNSRAKKLFLSQVNNPHNARNAVIVLGGQRANESHDDNGLTGQVSPYRFDGKTSSRTVTLRSDSYAKRLLDLGYFSADDTFVGLVFDARFPYEYGSSAKADLVRGYFNYIVSKLGNRAETIVMAGSSRGGCLSLQVAQLLLVRYPQARIIVQGFDPVCAAGNMPFIDSEFGVSPSPKTRNPLRQDVDWTVGPVTLSRAWEIFNTNMYQQFPSHRRSCLGITSYVSGDPVINNLDIHGIGHRGFHTSNGVGSLTTSSGRSWYEQSWSTDTHPDVVFNKTLWQKGLTHFQAAMQNMPCTCGRAPRLRFPHLHLLLGLPISMVSPVTREDGRRLCQSVMSKVNLCGERNLCTRKRRDRQLRVKMDDDCVRV